MDRPREEPDTIPRVKETRELLDFLVHHQDTLDAHEKFFVTYFPKENVTDFAFNPNFRPSAADPETPRAPREARRSQC